MFPRLIIWTFLCVTEAHRFRSHYGSSLIDFYNATHLESFKRGFLYNAFLIGRANDANEKCIDHLAKMREGLLSTETWAMKLVDSSGEFQSFASTGNLVNLGSYDECLRVTTDDFKGKYCRIKIIFNDSPAQNSSFVPYNVPLIFTFCSPDSCHESDLMKSLTSMDFNASYGVNCEEHDSKFTVTQILWIIFVTFILIAVISSTSYDIIKGHNYEGLNGLLCSFSLQRNNALLFSRNTVSLPCIHGLRYFCQLMVVLAHYWMHIMKNELPVLNKFELYEIIKSWKGSLIVNFALTVDVFFSISGYILAFTFLQNGSPRINVLRLCILRYLRLFPAYLVVVFYVSSFIERMCFGPLCSVEVTRNYELCREYWWSNVISLSNVFPGVLRSCLPHGWFIAADMQIFILFAPLVLYLLRFNIRATFAVLLFLTTWSMVSVFVISYLRELPVDNYEFNADTYVQFRKLYAAPYTRVKSWAVGVMFGTYSHFIISGNYSPCKIVTWVVCGLCFMISTISTYLAHTLSANHLTSAFITSTQGVLISVSTCCVIFACSMKFGGFLNKILTWPPLIPLSKISYSLYIVHLPILYLFFGSVRSPIDFSPVMQIPLVIGLYVICHVAAWVLCVTVEMPVEHFTKYFWKK